MKITDETVKHSCKIWLLLVIAQFVSGWLLMPDEVLMYDTEWPSAEIVIREIMIRLCVAVDFMNHHNIPFARPELFCGISLSLLIAMALYFAAGLFIEPGLFSLSSMVKYKTRSKLTETKGLTAC